ncbi:MAG: methylenetetrahydrofolate reductase C-terminal domain-containing protein [Pseudomonadota bacterium]
MIGTVQKPFSEILEALQSYAALTVVGCDGCAKACKTGGTEETNAMAERLRAAGKTIVLAVTPERTCYFGKTLAALEPHFEEIGQSDAILVLGCGGAVQITRQVLEDNGIGLPVKVGLDSVGHMDTVVMGRLALEQCQECGECILNETGGVCPVTKCAKSLLNGPCGGAENGKCEVDRERDCAWILIHERMARLGELDKLRRFIEPKDYSRMAKPRTLHIDEGRVS